MLILNKFINDPLNIFINGKLIASGEIVVLKDKYGIRITKINNSFKNVSVDKS